MFSDRSSFTAVSRSTVHAGSNKEKLWRRARSDVCFRTRQEFVSLSRNALSRFGSSVPNIRVLHSHHHSISIHLQTAVFLEFQQFPSLTHQNDCRKSLGNCNRFWNNLHRSRCSIQWFTRSCRDHQRVSVLFW